MDNSIYQAALEGLELQKQRIDDQIKQVRAHLAGTGKAKKAAPAPATATVKAGPAKKRRKLDAAAKKRISEAQKKRWATFREKQEGEKS